MRLNVTAIAIVNLAYFALVFLTSKWSAARAKPMGLRRVMQAYNLLCVGLAFYVVQGIARYKLGHNMGTFICNPMDLSTPEGKYLARVIWVYYAQKYVELLDTFIFIARQSWRQLTFLHVYHHSSITVVTALFLAFDVNGDCVVTAALLNAFVHVLMYSHYFLSSLGIKTWWRRYLTKIQLLQFVICWVQPVAAYFAGPACGYPDFLKVLMIVYQTTMMVLFAHFYRKAYKSRSRKDKESQD